MYEHKDKEWRCKKCGFLLGLVDPAGNCLRIKYKDLYVFFQGGMVSVFCRRCATRNTLIDEEYQKLHPEEVKPDAI